MNEKADLRIDQVAEKLQVDERIATFEEAVCQK